MTQPTLDAGPVTHGPYELVVSLVNGNLMIRREDSDRRKRLVAFVEAIDQWDRFVAALESGATEVAAVHAIDEVQS